MQAAWMAEGDHDAFVIDLGVPGAESWSPQRTRIPMRLRRRLSAAALTLFCVFTLAASARGSSGLGGPLWTGRISLNGFVLGSRSLYQWSLDDRAMTSLDQLTGRLRWSHAITEPPDSVMDTGDGVAVVMTRPASGGGTERAGTITLIRDATGEEIAQTTGDYFMPSADGRRVLVFARRPGGLDGCTGASGCLDVTDSDISAWDTSTGDLAWQLSLAPNTQYLTSTLDGRVDSLEEIDTDGAIRLRDLSTGSVTATTNLSLGGDLSSGPHVSLVHGWLLNAESSPEGVRLTAYRPATLGRGWSVVIADIASSTDSGLEQYLWECGPDACLTTVGVSTRLVDPSTGSVSPPIASDRVQWLDDGVFLAGTQPDEATTVDPGAWPNGLVLDAAGRTLTHVAVASVVDWSNSGDRGLVTQEGRTGTEFIVIDGQGQTRSLGSVPGTGLTCHAHADILACSDPAGGLRVWRLPG
jgi:hypothetical protein